MASPSSSEELLAELRRAHSLVLRAEHQHELDKLELLRKRINPSVQHLLEPKMANMTLPEVKKALQTKIAEEISQRQFDILNEDGAHAWSETVCRADFGAISDDDWFRIKDMLNNAVRDVLTEADAKFKKGGDNQSDEMSDGVVITDAQMQHDAQQFLIDVQAEQAAIAHAQGESRDM
jgi:hypothetical protein